MSWLAPLRSSVPELDDRAWDRLHRLDAALDERCLTAPVRRGADWTKWLLTVRHDLASEGHRSPSDASGLLWQCLAQFCAGFHDLDLRDVTGDGHGAMVVTDGVAATAQRWSVRLHEGRLVGIAATERHGGSRIQEITTAAEQRPDGGWVLLGEKCWVSRLHEAAAFVVFFRDPDGTISAAVIDADRAGVEREIVEPAGLAGWGWGVLRLHHVRVDPATDLVGAAGQGLDVFRRHFTRFRPLVTATALGTAAGVHTLTADTLTDRVGTGSLPRVRDNALIVLGRTGAEITAALLAAITTTRLALQGHPGADLMARIGKAAGVDTAHRAVSDLAPLVGASGFQQHSPITKARSDLTGLLYADGIHDSLYRSGGQSMLRSSTAAIQRAERRTHYEPIG